MVACSLDFSVFIRESWRDCFGSAQISNIYLRTDYKNANMCEHVIKRVLICASI